MDNLFIIRSPLQLLNAKEAIKHFNLENNLLILIDTKGLSNTIQLNNLLDEKEWKTIIRLKADKKSNFFEYIKLIRNLKKQQYGYLFLGDYGSIHQIIISNLNAKNIYLIDDGTATIKIYDEILNNKKNIKKELKRKIRFLFFGLKIKDKKTINFFTMFNLKSFKKTKVIKHEFKNLKNEYSLKEKSFSNEVYIVGQPFVKYGFLEKENYFYFLNKIIEEFSSYKIIYIYHRDEDIDYIKNNYKNIQLINNEVPSEIMFINNRTKPKYVIGLVSTLLFSLDKIFDDVNILSYHISNDKFKKEKDVIALLYSYIRDNNIKIKELK